MSDKTELYVDGYHFATPEDAEQARLERQKVEYIEQYIEQKLVKEDAKRLLAIYNKVLDEKIFVTPVGWGYLLELQKDLRALDVPEENIRPIPLDVSFSHKEADLDEVISQIAVRNKDIRKGKLRTSVILNIALCMLVVAMFIVTLNGSNPNILNYKRNIENQYAAWAQELTERERTVRQKEAEIEMEKYSQAQSVTKN